MVVCFCLNQLIGNYIAERPIQDEDNTSKKMLGGKTNLLIPTTKPPTQSYVYVIQEGKDQVAKVGCTTNPKKRMSDLQGGNYRRLDYYLVIQLKENSNKNKLAAEKEAQNYLEVNNFATKLNLGGGTEWYDTKNIGIAMVAEKVKEILQKKLYSEADVTQQFTKP